MNGAHHAKAGNRVTSVLKSARWLATLIGLILVVPALLALDIYSQFAATGLARLAWPAANIVILVILVVLWIKSGHVLPWRRRPSAGE